MILRFSPRSCKHVILWSLAAFVLFQVAWRIVAFVHIFGDHAGIALTQIEAAHAYYDGTPDSRLAVVPKIIHQVFHNWTEPGDETLPPDWNDARQSCIAQNPEWKNWLWTATSSRDFIREEYPWFLHTYDNFKFPVQRIDALRYFLLRRYGGIYIDLDNGCVAPLEPLRYYPAWVVDGARGALSNDILGAEPNHPYWILMTESIISYSWNYPLPYITISYATGQWFETAIWEKYHAQKPKDAPGLTRIITDQRPGAAPAVFFSHSRGGTWDNWDNRMFAWIGENLLVFITLVTGLVVLTLGTTLIVWRRVEVLLAGRKR